MDGFEAVVETVGPSRKYKDYTNVSIPVAYIMCVYLMYKLPGTTIGCLV